MTYQKIDVLAELKRMEKGQAPKVAPWLVTALAAPLVQAGLDNKEVNRLERLYRLEDPRG